jgi:hypothetical protein
MGMKFCILTILPVELEIRSMRKACWGENPFRDLRSPAEVVAMYYNSGFLDLDVEHRAAADRHGLDSIADRETVAELAEASARARQPAQSWSTADVVRALCWLAWWVITIAAVSYRYI